MQIGITGGNTEKNSHIKLLEKVKESLDGTVWEKL